MTQPWKALADRIAREPVLFFGAASLSLTAWAPGVIGTDAKKAAVSGVALFLTRAFTSSKRTAEENVEVAKWVAAVEQQATEPSHGWVMPSSPSPPIMWGTSGAYVGPRGGTGGIGGGTSGLIPPEDEDPSAQPEGE